MDFDFTAERSESPFSDLHWHPCRYPSQIPSTVIGRLSSPGDLILDPFLGSGTTLTEAQRLGRRSLGIDINPISALIARSKTLPVGAAEVGARLKEFESKLRISWRDKSEFKAPESVQSEKWYTPQTVAALSKIWALVGEDETYVKPILLSAFSSILLPACRETRHWGYVCDNSTPKGDYERDVLKLYVDRLRAWAKAYMERDSHMERAGTPMSDATVLAGDSGQELRALADGVVKLVLTSPPYQGVADYVKAQRLSMEWLDLPIEPLRLREIGARSKRHRRSASEDYVSDLSVVFRECHRVLSKDGWVVSVIGESAQRGAVIERYLSEMETVGFSVEAIRHRQISQSRRQMPSLNQEAIIFMRRAQ